MKQLDRILNFNRIFERLSNCLITGSAPASGAVSEEREVDKGHLYRQSNSVPPDALRTQGQL